MVHSPCNGVCRLDPATGWCLGCGRTIDEIAAWSSLDDGGRRAVWARLPARRAQRPAADAAPPPEGPLADPPADPPADPLAGARR